MTNDSKQRIENYCLTRMYALQSCVYIDELTLWSGVGFSGCMDKC